ncbi:TPA: hypothetical protein ACH3X1_015674 [Trebouxia sp. C0004]
MTLCAVMNADTSYSNTPGLASLYEKPGMNPDILEKTFENAGVHEQSDFIIHYSNPGGPAEADVAIFASIGKPHSYKGHEMYDKDYRLQILCKHDRCDKRMSERHVLHITEADKLQIFLKFLYSLPARPNQEEPLMIIDTRRNVFAKENTTLLLEVKMAELPYQATTQIFKFLVSEIGKAFLRRYNRTKYRFTQCICHAETWDEGKYGFIVIGKAEVPVADLEAELQDAVNDRCNTVNNEIGGYKEEAMCEKMAKAQTPTGATA